MQGTISAIGSLSTLTIQPSSGDEWVIHNIYTSSTIDFKIVGAGGTVTLEPNLTSCLTGYFFHASNSQYYQIVNKTNGTIYAGFDGIEIK